MVDAHCHLVDSKYGAESPEEIAGKSMSLGVELICNGCGLSESTKSVEIANTKKGVWVCVGLAYDSDKVDLVTTKNKLKELCANNKVVGIGEAGLDNYEGMRTELSSWQERLFRMHLELAKEMGLPIQIHNRNADDQVLDLVDEYQVAGMLHCFSGNLEFMKKAIKRNLYISIGGLATFKSRNDLREVIKEIPENRIILETDAPYLAPEPIRGTVNRPENVRIVAEMVANIRGTSINQIDFLTTNNTRQLFGRMTI